MKLSFFLGVGLLVAGQLQAQSEHAWSVVAPKSTQWVGQEVSHHPLYHLSLQGDAAGESLRYALRLLPELSLEAEGLCWQGSLWPELAVDGRVVRLLGAALDKYLESFPIEEVKAIELVHNTMRQFNTPAEYVLNVRLHSPRAGHLYGYNTLSGQLQGFVSEGLEGRLAYSNKWMDADLRYGAGEMRSAQELRLNEQREEEWIAPRREGWGKVQLAFRPTQAQTLCFGGGYLRAQEDLKYSKGPRAAFTQEGWTAQSEYVWHTPSFSFRIAGEGEQRQVQRYYRQYSDAYLPYRDALYTMGAGQLELLWKLNEQWRLKTGTTAHYNKHQTVLIQPRRGRVVPEYFLQEWRMLPQIQVLRLGSHSSLALGVQLSVDSLQHYYATGLESQGTLQLRLFPQAYFSYWLNSRHRFELEWESHLVRPGFRQLNAGLSLNGELLQVEGNRNLKPMSKHQLSARYFYRNSAFIEAQIVQVDDPWVQELEAFSSDSYRLHPVNWTSSRHVQASGYFPLHLVRQKHWAWRSDFSVWWRNQQDKHWKHGAEWSREYRTYMLQLEEHFRLPGNWGLTCGGHYRSAHYWGDWKVREQWWITAEVAKYWKNWRLSFAAYDPLHRKVYSLERADNLSQRLRLDNFTPRLQVSLTWLWGTGRKSRTSLLEVENRRLPSTAREGIVLP